MRTTPPDSTVPGCNTRARAVAASAPAPAQRRTVTRRRSEFQGDRPLIAGGNRAPPALRPRSAGRGAAQPRRGHHSQAPTPPAPRAAQNLEGRWWRAVPLPTGALQSRRIRRPGSAPAAAGGRGEAKRRPARPSRELGGGEGWAACAGRRCWVERGHTGIPLQVYRPQQPRPRKVSGFFTTCHDAPLGRMRDSGTASILFDKYRGGCRLFCFLVAASLDLCKSA